MMVVRRALALLRKAVVEVVDLVVAAGAAALMALVRLVPERTAANVAGTVARVVGMRLPVTRRVGLPNLKLAFPEKSEAEHRVILAECWDNLGRIAVEYCQLDRIWDFDPKTMRGDRVTFNETSLAHYVTLRDDGKPAIVIAAHLANWELPMVAAAAHGLDAAALYRAPNNRWIARWVRGQRRVAMGELVTSRAGAVNRLSQILAENRHVGLLADQYFYDGIRAPFFGHDTLSNQMFARLARIHDCPVHAVRVIRLPGDRFELELTGALDLPRDVSGRVDPAGAVVVMNALFERWVREHPGQWLWLHRKWRGDDTVTRKEARRRARGA
jgi:KDO2-lipid IV(A) lauroyltransferase